MDAAEFDHLYATSVHRLVGVLYAMTGDLARAQDVVREAFIRAWDHRGQLEVNPETWVRTMAGRLAMSRWRRLRSALTAGQHPGPAAAIVPAVLPHPELITALRRLPDAQRQAIVLFYLCDRSVDQVAIETGAQPRTVTARLDRGRASLAKYRSGFLKGETVG